MKKLSALLSIIAIFSLTACQQQPAADDSLQGSDLNTYIEQGLTDEYRVSDIPNSYIQIHTFRGVVNPCTEDADGPCGQNLGVYAEEDVQEGNQEFYFGTTAGGPMGYYGPFNDDLRRLIFE